MEMAVGRGADLSPCVAEAELVAGVRWLGVLRAPTSDQRQDGLVGRLLISAPCR